MLWEHNYSGHDAAKEHSGLKTAKYVDTLHAAVSIVLSCVGLLRQSTQAA